MKAFKTKKELYQYSKENRYCVQNTTQEIVEFVKANQGKYFYLFGADLKNADFSNLNLSGSNLAYADFNENTNFTNTILIDAFMYMSNLYNCKSFDQAICFIKCDCGCEQIDKECVYVKKFKEDKFYLGSTGRDFYHSNQYTKYSKS